MPPFGLGGTVGRRSAPRPTRASTRRWGRQSPLPSYARHPRWNSIAPSALPRCRRSMTAPDGHPADARSSSGAGASSGASETLACLRSSGDSASSPSTTRRARRWASCRGGAQIGDAPPALRRSGDGVEVAGRRVVRQREVGVGRLAGRHAVGVQGRRAWPSYPRARTPGTGIGTTGLHPQLAPSRLGAAGVSNGGAAQRSL
jgi:hypothetical protein